jgi:hypothetical protein
MKKVIIGITVALIAVLVVCLVPLKTVAYTVMVDYQDTETYYENEPYEVTETYTETVPLAYEVVKDNEYTEGTATVVSVTVQNTDSVPGTFTVDLSIIYGCTFIAPGRIELTSMVASDKRELYLEPNHTGTATYTADNPYPANCAVKSSSWGVTPDTKQVQKERTVTKYRQVEKQRTVTKQRPETRYKTVTILEYLSH